MKNNTILLFLSLAFLITLGTSCGSDDDTSSNEPDPNGALFVNFKIDGEQKEYTSTQGFWGGGSSGQTHDIWASNLAFSGGDISFNFMDVDSITEATIMGLDGQSITFEDNTTINADFYMDHDGVDGASYHADNTASTNVITITDVHEELGIPIPPGFGLGKLFRVTGTFKCDIADGVGGDVMELTDGEFSLVFQEGI